MQQGTDYHSVYSNFFSTFWTNNVEDFLKVTRSNFSTELSSQIFDCCPRNFLIQERIGIIHLKVDPETLVILPSPSKHVSIHQPQRSNGKAMFLHLSVILFTEGVLCPRGLSVQGSLCPQGASVEGWSLSGRPPPPPSTLKCGWYASYYWNAFLLQYMI